MRSSIWIHKFQQQNWWIKYSFQVSGTNKRTKKFLVHILSDTQCVIHIICTLYNGVVYTCTIQCIHLGLRFLDQYSHSKCTKCSFLYGSGLLNFEFKKTTNFQVKNCVFLFKSKTDTGSDIINHIIKVKSCMMSLSTVFLLNSI